MPPEQPAENDQIWEPERRAAPSVGGGATGSMREFESAVNEATEALGGGGGQGGGPGGKGGKGGGLIAAAKKAGLIAAAFTAAGNLTTGFTGTGTLEGGIGTARRGAVDFTGLIPGVGGLLGTTMASKVLGKAEERTGGFLGQAAALGMDVTDKQIQADLDITIGQEKRRAQLEARVKGIAGSSENVSEAMPDVFGGMENVLKEILAEIKGVMGGSAR